MTLLEMNSCERTARLVRRIRAVTLVGCALYGIWSTGTNSPVVHAVCDSNIVRDAAALARLLGCKRENGHEADKRDIVDRR